MGSSCCKKSSKDPSTEQTVLPSPGSIDQRFSRQCSQTNEVENPALVLDEIGNGPHLQQERARHTWDQSQEHAGKISYPPMPVSGPEPTAACGHEPIISLPGDPNGQSARPVTEEHGEEKLQNDSLTMANDQREDDSNSLTEEVDDKVVLDKDYVTMKPGASSAAGKSKTEAKAAKPQDVVLRVRMGSLTNSESSTDSEPTAPDYDVPRRYQDEKILKRVSTKFLTRGDGYIPADIGDIVEILDTQSEDDSFVFVKHVGRGDRGMIPRNCLEELQDINNEDPDIEDVRRSYNMVLQDDTPSSPTSVVDDLHFFDDDCEMAENESYDRPRNIVGSVKLPCSSCASASSSSNHSGDSVGARPKGDKVGLKKTISTAFLGRGDDHLRVDIGDTVEIIQEDGEWLQVRRHGRGDTGYIPNTCIQHYEDLCEDSKDNSLNGRKPVTLREKLETYMAPRKSEGKVHIWDEPWFFGWTSHAECERFLYSQGNEEGTFLVRFCTRVKGAYVLSVLTCKGDRRGVSHFLIHSYGPCFYLEPDKTFKSLTELITFYQDGVTMISIKQPCPRQDLSDDETHRKMSYTDVWELDRSTVKIGVVIGKGNFGTVYKGWVGGQDVAIKELSQAHPDSYEEADIMKSFSHPNLVKLIGMCTTGTPVYIVTELMCNGALDNYLKEGEGIMLGVDDLVKIAAQVASGMAYLERKAYVHRDLAARNVLVGEDNVVKVADFGLTRMLDNEGIYMAAHQRQLPIRWTAPECFIRDPQFTTKSDVWSFGVLLTEIFTHGRKPYHDITTNKDLVLQLELGHRMSKPDLAPVEMYQTMLMCWEEEPQRRPTFEFLESVCNALVQD